MTGVQTCALPICGADDRGWYAELAQIDAGVHHIAGRVAPIEAFPSMKR